jgi:hypothetical protein
MQTFKIKVLGKDEDSKVYHWKTVPRIGEVVETGDCSHPFPHVVTKVIHYFRRDGDPKESEIGLVTDPPYGSGGV